MCSAIPPVLQRLHGSWYCIRGQESIRNPQVAQRKQSANWHMHLGLYPESAQHPWHRAARICCAIGPRIQEHPLILHSLLIAITQSP